MKNITVFTMSLCLMGLWSHSAHADLDQLCLKQCVANGSATNSCMSQCTYGPPATSLSATTPFTPPSSKHRVFNSPIPVGNELVTTPKQAPEAPTKDYGCFEQCLRTGTAYQLCNERCVKVDCPASAVLCRSSVNTVAGPQTFGSSAASQTATQTGKQLTAPH